MAETRSRMEMETHEPVAAPKVLVVDDYAANREFMRLLLEDDGYAVRLAASGAEALAAFVADPPDCVLLDVRMPDVDGFAVCQQIRALPHGPGTPIVFVTAMRDVETFDRAVLVGGDDFLTKPIQAAELLVRVRTVVRLRQLSSERHGLFDAIRDQRAALTRLLLRKEQLTSFLLNDLKLPVGSMALHAQSILQDDLISEDSRDAARNIRSDARQLMRLILNLLDITRADGRPPEPRRQPTDLAGLARDVLLVMEVQAETAGVALRVDGAANLSVDPGLIRRMLASLLDNAIRHAPVGSEVRVEIVADPDGAELRVIDAGFGIPCDRHDAVFDRSVPDPGDETAVGRSGLGLAFCKLAVEAHGGRIWIEDANPGAIFAVRLPHDT